MKCKIRLVIATGNPGKVKEFRNILGDEDFEFLTLADIGFDDEIVEDGDSFAANALIKARAVHRSCGLAVLADDSGLEVEALNGAPGIRTARFAGENASDDDNIDLLLENLSAGDNRRARFFCALVYIDHAGKEQVFEGSCLGEILEKRRGTQGFGYDPVFLPRGQTLAFGEMLAAEKKALSHRGMAIKKFSKFLQTEA